MDLEINLPVCALGVSDMTRIHEAKKKGVQQKLLKSANLSWFIRHVPDSVTLVTLTIPLYLTCNPYLTDPPTSAKPPPIPRSSTMFCSSPPPRANTPTTHPPSQTPQRTSPTS